MRFHIRRSALGLALALALLTAAPAHAQRAYAPNRIDVIERIAAACPGYIRQDHDFTDTAATVLK